MVGLGRRMWIAVGMVVSLAAACGGEEAAPAEDPTPVTTTVGVTDAGTPADTAAEDPGDVAEAPGEDQAEVTVPDALTVPFPAGGTVLSSAQNSGAVIVIVTYDPARYDEIVGHYDEWTAGTGDDWIAVDTSMEIAGDRFRGFSWASGAAVVALADCSSTVGGGPPFDLVCLTLTEDI